MLKENLERLVDGMGHSEIKVGWAYSSKDRTPEQNVTFLTQKLEESWELIKEKKLPLSSDLICPALYPSKDVQANVVFGAKAVGTDDM